MKSTIIIAIFIAVTALISCKKDKKIIPTSGTASAMINGENWSINTVKGKVMSDTSIVFWVGVQKLDEYNEPYPYEDLVFRIFKKTDIQLPQVDINILPYVHFGTSIENGHANNEEFEILLSDTTNNWVQITEESGDYKEIKGKFSLTLIKTDVGIDPNRYPDTLRIRDGVFSVTLD